MTPDTALEADIAAWIDQNAALRHLDFSAHLAAHLAGLGYRKAEPDAVTLPLRWTKDGIGDALLWAGPLNVGYVHPLSGSSEGNWRADGCLAVFSGVYATKAEAMAALQAAVLKALAE